jgi:Rrf2 family cysteine metabolism transcriptional repressor
MDEKRRLVVLHGYFQLEWPLSKGSIEMGSKGFYGLLAMAELVQSYKDRKPVQVKDIARRHRIPEEYLGQIMVLLKRARLVHGTRGPGGGYRLARPPETITMGHVLKTLEGPLMVMDLRNQKSRSASSEVARRLMQTWSKAVEASEKVFDEVSLADLCKPAEQAQMYYI